MKTIPLGISKFILHKKALRVRAFLYKHQLHAALCLCFYHRYCNIKNNCGYKRINLYSDWFLVNPAHPCVFCVLMPPWHGSEQGVKRFFKSSDPGHLHRLQFPRYSQDVRVLSWDFSLPKYSKDMSPLPKGFSLPKHSQDVALCTSPIPVLKRQMQVDLCEFQASQRCIERPCPQNNNNNKPLVIRVLRMLGQEDD